mmetsp:Transcript_6621/g.21700  ORF Transcript_6621/g.21700 Transcript_6621/m.21700 type:complete len:254 (+) Transcript_6621:913-1674(+)|eukprot:scaffold8413_cov135-Isochrysis_galbana.AAC.4
MTVMMKATAIVSYLAIRFMVFLMYCLRASSSSFMSSPSRIPSSSASLSSSQKALRGVKTQKTLYRKSAMVLSQIVQNRTMMTTLAFAAWTAGVEPGNEAFIAWKLEQNAESRYQHIPGAAGVPMLNRSVPPTISMLGWTTLPTLLYSPFVNRKELLRANLGVAAAAHVSDEASVFGLSSQRALTNSHDSAATQTSANGQSLVRVYCFSQAVDTSTNLMWRLFIAQASNPRCSDALRSSHEMRFATFSRMRGNS